MCTDKKGTRINLCFKGWYKCLWFSVENNNVAMEKFKIACKELDCVIDDTEEWEEFLIKVQKHFKNRGFVRIAK